VQDTIIKLIKKQQTKGDIIKQSVKTARNILIDYHRKQQKFKNLYDKEPEPLCYQNCEITFIIPDKYKSLYILRYKFGLKYVEISEFLDKPLGSVKAQIKRMKEGIKTVNNL
jgi:DNA-directed RNA polymerase specialized sigma24 family protein